MTPSPPSVSVSVALQFFVSSEHPVPPIGVALAFPISHYQNNSQMMIIIIKIVLWVMTLKCKTLKLPAIQNYYIYWITEKYPLHLEYFKEIAFSDLHVLPTMHPIYVMLWMSNVYVLGLGKLLPLLLAFFVFARK